MIAYLTTCNVSREELTELVLQHREDPTKLPPVAVCSAMARFFLTALRGEALEIVSGEKNGFVSYMKLIERFDHLRMSRFSKISQKIANGVVFENNLDKLFREYKELNLQLRDWKASIDDRLLLTHILRVLPESYGAAKAMIGLRTDITLVEAKSILQFHKDQMTLCHLLK